MPRPLFPPLLRSLLFIALASLCIGFVRADEIPDNVMVTAADPRLIFGGNWTDWGTGLDPASGGHRFSAERNSSVTLLFNGASLTSLRPALAYCARARRQARRCTGTPALTRAARSDASPSTTAKAHLSISARLRRENGWVIRGARQKTVRYMHQKCANDEERESGKLSA